MSRRARELRQNTFALGVRNCYPGSLCYNLQVSDDENSRKTMKEKEEAAERMAALLMDEEIAKTQAQKTKSAKLSKKRSKKTL